MKPNEATPILCGTDFSANASKAATTAAALAARAGRALLLVHVADEFNACSDDRKKLAALLEPVEKQLEREAQRLRATGATVETKLLTGQVAERAIGEFVRQQPPALVVVSSVSKTAFDRWTLGTVSASLAESVAVPTLVVRSSEPFEAWARGERPLKVFVGVDFTTSSDAALRWIAELREIGPCEVVAGFVDWPPEESSRLGVPVAPGFFENRAEVQAVLERDLRRKVAGFLGDESVRVCVRGNWGRADAPLVEMAIEAQADLVVVGTHQRRGLDRFRRGSVSRGTLQLAPMSVACVPTPAVAPVAGPRFRECTRVLVAVDLGAAHGFAAPYAYSIVQPGGTVRLVHNIMPFRLPNPMIGGSYQDFPTPKEQAQLVAEAEAKLRTLAPNEAEARGIVTEVEVSESRETAEAICAAAERFGADVICIGSHTRPGFTAKVLGSVSLAVLQGSRRPVLVVWPPAE